MTRRRFVIALLLIGAAGFGLRIAHALAIHETPAWTFDRVWIASDMHANRQWAEHLASGDWLDREAFRPHYDWQDNVADPATWRRWLGTSTYYQPPLYPYLLAASSKFASGTDPFRWFQLFLGAANAVLIGLLGRRFIGSWAGLLAAGAAAAYGPFVFYDAELLRGTVSMTLNLLALLALHRAAFPSAGAAEGSGKDAGSETATWRAKTENRDESLRSWAWVLAGALLGVCYLADSAIVTFIPLALLWAFFWAGESKSLARSGWLAAGIAFALLPLAVRNIAVGAPLLSATTRAPLAFVIGNAPDGIPAGAGIPESTAAILHAGDYGLLSTMKATIRAYGPSPGGIVEKQWQKLTALFNSHEIPDNPSFYYAALGSPVLRGLLRFACLSGLGLAGLLLAARRARHFALLYLWLAGILLLFPLAHVVSRYRQPVVVPLMLFGAFAVARGVEALRARRLATGAAILAGGVALSFALPARPPHGYREHRKAEFLVAAAAYEEKGEISRAGKEVARGIDHALRENAPVEERVEMGLELGALYLRHERYPESLSAYRDVLEEEPRNVEALLATGGIYHDTRQPMEALSTLERVVALQPENAEAHARLGHLYWMTFKEGRLSLDHIRKALELDPGGPAAAGLSALAGQVSAATGLTP